MKLWTIHNTEDFSLCSGHVDHSKSDYYNNKRGVKEAYQKLWPLIKVPDGQIIWCYTCKEDTKTPTPKIQWSLEVPRGSIITYIDDIMWNCILGIKVKLTPRYMRNIRAAACSRFPYDGQKRRSYEEELENDFWNNVPSQQELWSKLLIDEAIDGSPVILKHPIREEWITDKCIISARQMRK